MYTTSAAFTSYFQRSVSIWVYWPDVRAGSSTTLHHISYLSLSLSLSLSRHCDLSFVTGNTIALILSYYVGFTKFPEECIILGKPVEGRPKILDNVVGTRNLKTNMNKWKTRKKTYPKNGDSAKEKCKQVKTAHFVWYNDVIPMRYTIYKIPTLVRFNFYTLRVKIWLCFEGWIL